MCLYTQHQLPLDHAEGRIPVNRIVLHQNYHWLRHIDSFNLVHADFQRTRKISFYSHHAIAGTDNFANETGTVLEHYFILDRCGVLRPAAGCEHQKYKPNRPASERSGHIHHFSSTQQHYNTDVNFSETVW